MTIGGQDDLPVYTSLPASQQEERIELENRCTDCSECLMPFDHGVSVMRCYACGMMAAHVHCLAKRFLREAGDPVEVIPREGRCPRSTCAQRLLWAMLVRGASTYLSRTSVEICPNPDSIGSVGRARYVDDGCGGVDGRDRQVSPKLWLVDDSSDDENDEGEWECGSSERGSQYEGEYNSDGETPAGKSYNDQDSWLSIEHGYQGTVQEDENDVLRESGSPWSLGGRLAGCDGRPGDSGARISVDLCGGDDDVPLVGSSLGIGEAEEGEQSPPSPPMLSLSERLRLRRFAISEHG